MNAPQCYVICTLPVLLDVNVNVTSSASALQICVCHVVSGRRKIGGKVLSSDKIIVRHVWNFTLVYGLY